MVMAAIDPAREAELRQLLESMNEGPGQASASNPLIPFGQFDRLHFARLLILEDKTLNEVRAYGGGPAPTYPFSLAFLGDIDGGVDDFLRELVQRAGTGLRAIFSCCVGFNANADLVSWMKSHHTSTVAGYVNWKGRTVRRIREEAALRKALVSHMASQAAVFQKLGPRQVQVKLQQFLNTERAAERLKLSGENSTPIGWWIKNLLHMIGIPLLVLLFLPLLILGAPFFIIWLRHLEKTDPELCWRVDQKYADALSRLEDHDVTNQFSLLGNLKPGLFRLAVLIGVLLAVDYAARHVVRRGRLGRVRSIHFARWVFLDRKKRMVFFSNYDGTVESYMDDFINKAGFGLNAFLCNGIGYIRTNWLVLDGCNDEQKYRNFLRRHTLPTEVWYKAYPGLTAIDLERNTRIREGLESPSMSEEEARTWAALL